jgi:hypothetical protein
MSDRAKCGIDSLKALLKPMLWAFHLMAQADLISTPVKA